MLSTRLWSSLRAIGTTVGAANVGHFCLVHDIVVETLDRDLSPLMLSLLRPINILNFLPKPSAGSLLILCKGKHFVKRQGHSLQDSEGIFQATRSTNGNGGFESACRFVEWWKDSGFKQLPLCLSTKCHRSYWQWFGKLKTPRIRVLRA